MNLTIEIIFTYIKEKKKILSKTQRIYNLSYYLNFRIIKIYFNFLNKYYIKDIKI